MLPESARSENHEAYNANNNDQHSRKSAIADQYQ